MSINVSEHKSRSFSSGSRRIHTVDHETAEGPSNQPKLYEVDTSLEVNQKIESAKNSLMSEIQSLEQSLGSVKSEMISKIQNSLDNINDLMSQIPDIIKNDEDFKRELKEDVLAEIRKDL